MKTMHKFLAVVISAALAAGLKVIVCVGENLAQRELGVTEELVRMQTKIALSSVTAEEMGRVLCGSFQ